MCVIKCDAMFVMNLERVEDWQLLTSSPERFISSSQQLGKYIREKVPQASACNYMLKMPLKLCKWVVLTLMEENSIVFVCLHDMGNMFYLKC